MKLDFTQIRLMLAKHTLGLECGLVFLTALFVYLSNQQLISSNDSIPNSLLAFHWLENGSLNFDAFRDSYHYMPNDIFGANGIPYFFVEAPNGHLTSAYPIGPAILSFPLYVLFFVYLKGIALLQSGFANPALDLTNPAFETTRQQFEKLAGACLTALAVMIFHLAVQIKFNKSVALFATFIYAFATLNWAISAQGLWAHTVFNLALISIMLALFKAERSTASRRHGLLLVAGFFCGLLPSIRLTGLLFVLAIFAYVGITYRKQVIWLVIGASSALFNLFWNIFYFGFSLKSSIAGGYSTLMQTSGEYIFSVDYFKEAFFGLLISPGRGTLIFSPILLSAIPGIYRIFQHRQRTDEKLLLLLLAACGILFLQYCFYRPWWGAITYGSRFLIDTLPVFCYLIGYFLIEFLFGGRYRSRLQSIGIWLAFSLLLLYSTLVQVIGAFSQPHIWDITPGFEQSRFWDWQDSPIERHARNLKVTLNPPVIDTKAYRRRWKGEILQLQDGNNQVIPATNVLQVPPSQEILLRAKLQNRGQSAWFGYDTGLVKGQTIVHVEFFDQNDQQIKVTSLNYLYLPGQIVQGETAVASGKIRFPQNPGEYKLVLRLGLMQMARLPQSSQGAGRSTYELKIRVQAPD